MKNFKKFLIIKLTALIFFCSNASSFAFTANINSFEKSKLYSTLKKTKPAANTKEELIKIIDNYIKNEQYTEAMMELNKLLLNEQNDPEIYIMSATLLRKTYQFDEAQEMAKKALKLNYKSSAAYLELGHIFFDKARFSANDSNIEKPTEMQRIYLAKSFDYFFMASQYDLSDPLPHIALAEAFYANYQKNKANDEILKAKDLSFNNPEAYFQIGNYYYKTKKYDDAQKYIQKSIEQGRTCSNKAYFLLAKLYEQKGNLDEAQKTYLKTLELKPDMLEAQKHLDALIKVSYKEKKAEEKTPTNLFTDINEDLNVLMKAEYFLVLDEYTKARDLFIKLLEKDPKNANAVAGLAELYYSMWKKGYGISNNFASDALYIIKSEISNRNEVALLKFQIINETKIPEKIRQELINLSITDSFDFYDLLNEIRAEFLLGNYEESHNKLFKLSKLDLSNYEKFKVLKHLCYDHNYYEALILINELKKTYYHNEEIEPVEKRIKTKLGVAEEKFNDALKLWKKKQYNDAIFLFKEIINYFPTYKPAYLYTSFAMDKMENYTQAYDYLNVYYKLYKIYPDKEPEIKESEIKDMIQDLYKKIKEESKSKNK